MSGENAFFSFLDHLTVVDDDSSSYEIEVGNDGFSYLDMLSEKRGKRVSFEDKQRRATSAALDGSTRAGGQSNVSKVDSVDHDAVCFDTDLASIVSDLQQRRNKIPLLPLAAAGAIVILAAVAWLPPVLRILNWIVLFPALAFALWNVYRLDVSRRHSRFKYTLSGKGSDAFRSINEALEALASSRQVLVRTGTTHFADTRYSGGAESLPAFGRVRLDRKAPPLVEVGLDVWHVRASSRDLYFMPDHLLAFDGGRIGGISYSKLGLSGSLEETQARDIAQRTDDAVVVGQTWRFVNNDGTPDKRFNNNIQVPVIAYGTLRLTAPGLDMEFYTTRQSASTSAPARFDGIKELAGKAQVMVAEAKRRKNGAESGENGELHEVLLDAMCCMMIADKKATSEEKRRIRELMREAGCGWPAEEIDSRVRGFVKKVKESGPSGLLSDTHRRLRLLKATGRGPEVLPYIESLANADGVLDDAERKIYTKFQETLS